MLIFQMYIGEVAATLFDDLKALCYGDRPWVLLAINYVVIVFVGWSREGLEMEDVKKAIRSSCYNIISPTSAHRDDCGNGIYLCLEKFGGFEMRPRRKNVLLVRFYCYVRLLCLEI